MILKNAIREQIVNYFNSEQWENFMNVLSRGHEVRHMHVYIESILHPEALENIVEAYLEKKAIKFKGKKGLISHGKGYTNVYYIQPDNGCHFEIMSLYNKNFVIKPMSSKKTREGKPIAYWDDEYMENYYKKFSFNSMDNEAREKVQDYFFSEAWEKCYAEMAYNDEILHSHCIVETNLHPEDIKPIGRKAIESRGWEVDRAISVVFNPGGMDIGKITYLLSKPDIVLELEWDFNPDVLIKPAVKSFGRIIKQDNVVRDMENISYINLDNEDIEYIKNKI